MAADFSRVRFDALRDYAGVELKQGGVLLDADANELVAIIDRRLRALAGDTLGRAAVASITPDAFQISAAAGGGLTIGKGRLYVDGLLAQNHGVESTDVAKRAFDSQLAERMFVDAIPYSSQPCLPGPPALPRGVRHLVYLDVWDREVTHLEQPNLVESAVAVETSSRIQTVWQVRVLAEDAGAADCATPDASIPGWATVIAPSTGVLTTGTVDIPQTHDACDLPPTGGYRGPENQLYRVEIQDPGQPGGGKATFKWSRENASVGSRVARMVSATELELDSLGRDDVLRFDRDDWVEIIDDAREFSLQRCGEMRKITINAAGHIEFAPALPADMLPGAFPNADFPRKRNLRVRRWDQKHKVLKVGANGTTSVFQDLDTGTSGVIHVPAANTTLLLENGVTVSFASTGAKGFKAGDHWVFAARTSDASVEFLDHAPPRGTHHHYARLGIWDVAGATVTDCRHRWPPQTGGGDCACTACVTPESHAGGHLTIQQAIKSLRDTGGTVCLREGHYVLKEAVHIDGAKSLRVQGQGPATVITAAGAAFIIGRSAAIAIEDLAILSLGRESAINVRTAFGLTLRRLVVSTQGNIDARGAAVALSGVVAGAAIVDNLFVAPDGVRALELRSEEGVPRMLLTAGLRIDTNVFSCRDSAVRLAGPVAHAFETRVTGNQVVGCRQIGVAVESIALPGASIRIGANTLNVVGPGIRCAADGVWIEGNKIRATRDGDQPLKGSGISLTPGLDRNASDQAHVLANQISGFPEAGISIGAPVRDLIVNLNIVENCGNGIVMTDAASAGSLDIEDNHLRDIGLSAAHAAEVPAPMTLGIGITRTESATVAGNTLRKIGLESANKSLVAGIAAFSVQHPRISGNVVSELGPDHDRDSGLVAGITVRAPFVQAEVLHNHVERDARANNAQSESRWYALQIDEPALGGNVPARIGIYAAPRVDPNRTLVLFGKHAYVDNVISAAGLDPSGAAAATPRSSVSILGNVFGARGRTPAVEAAAGEVLFSDNRCLLRTHIPHGIHAVHLNTPIALINANRVRGGEHAIHVPAVKDTLVAATGNITSPGIDAPLQAEMVPLNLRG